MPSAPSQLAPVRLPATIAGIGPAAGALVLLAGVALTGVTLYYWWPAGIALGLLLGLGTSVVLGTRMQLANRTAPADDDLAARLGLVDERRVSVSAPTVSAPAASAPTAQAPVAPAPAAAVAPAPLPEPAPLSELQPLPDLLYFDEGDVRVAGAAGDPVRLDLADLQHELGDDYTDFARAARLVVSTQYASAARLQRELHLPYSRARRLLTDLEQQHFVGPATGSLPRQVLMPKERLPEVERLLAV